MTFNSVKLVLLLEIKTEIMKGKCLGTLVLIFSVFMVFAQEENNSNSFKPKTGNISFEVDFLPFSADGPIRLNAFRGRYFIKDNIAINLNASFDREKLHNELPYKYDDFMVFDTQDAKYNVFSIGTGLEYHFLNSKRVSPYAGIGFSFERKSSQYEDEVNKYNPYLNELETVSTDIENAWQTSRLIGYDQYGNPYYVPEISERAYNALRIQLVLGADVYILKHFYMGVELGFGYNNVAYKEVIVKQNENMEYKYPEAKDSHFGFVYNNAIRLGFWF